MSWIEQYCFGLDPEDLGLTEDEEIVWECKNGDVIPIKDMTDYHLKNCIDTIKRSIRCGEPWRASYLVILLDEQYKRNREKLCKKIIFISGKKA